MDGMNARLRARRDSCFVVLRLRLWLADPTERGLYARQTGFYVHRRSAGTPTLYAARRPAR